MFVLFFLLFKNIPAIQSYYLAYVANIRNTYVQYATYRRIYIFLKARFATFKYSEEFFFIFWIIVQNYGSFISNNNAEHPVTNVIIKTL